MPGKNIAAQEGDFVVQLQPTAAQSHQIVVRTLGLLSNVRMPTTPESTWRLLNKHCVPFNCNINIYLVIKSLDQRC